MDKTKNHIGDHQRAYYSLHCSKKFFLSYWWFSILSPLNLSPSLLHHVSTFFTDFLSLLLHVSGSLILESSYYAEKFISALFFPISPMRLILPPYFSVKSKESEIAIFFSLFRWRRFSLRQKSTAFHWSLTYPPSFFHNIWETHLLILFLLILSKVTSLPSFSHLSLHISLWHSLITQKASLFSRQFYPEFHELQPVAHFSHPLGSLGFIHSYFKRDSYNLMVFLECTQPNIQLFRLHYQWCGQIYHTVQKNLKLELKLDLEYGITQQLALESDEILSTRCI